MIPTDHFFSLRTQNGTLEKLRKPTLFKAIWISDVHLGTSQCHAGRLLELLQLTESESLYFTGDIAGGQELKHQQHWEESHREVVQAIIEKANRGTRVTLMPGSHAASLRRFFGHKLPAIQIRDELVHVTAQGKRMLVIDGDQFVSAARGRFSARRRGAKIDMLLRKTRTALSGWRELIGLPARPLASVRYGRPVEAVYLRSLELVLTNEARQKGLDGVICSHQRTPGIRNIGGILYCNDGDWTEHQSAIVEDLSGALKVITWHDIILQADRAALCEELSTAENCADTLPSLAS